MRGLLRAFFTFELGAERNEAVLRALGPELSHEIPRASARAWLEGPSLRLEITAQDPAALRAAVNSYLRWVRVAAEAAGAGAGEGARESGAASERGTPDRGAEGPEKGARPPERATGELGKRARVSTRDRRVKRVERGE